jgi:hypothetical protein
VGICFLLMFWMTEAHRRRALGRRNATFVWGLYGVMALAALWSHLLAAIVLFLMGLWWLAEIAAAARRDGLARAARSPLAIGGALAQGLAALLFLPWLVEMHNQVANLAGPRREWMTPPTVLNFLKVFALWQPWGGYVDSWARGGALPWILLWGCLAPGGAMAWLAWRRASACRRRAWPAGREEAAWRLARAGIALGVANVAVLWSLDRFGVQHVFHGPRYAIFSGVAWAAGLAGVAVSAQARLRGARAAFGHLAVWLLIAAWVAPSLAGMSMETRLERDGVYNLPQALEIGRGLLPPPGKPLYVLPSCLIPYYRRTLARWDVRPAEAMTEIPDGADGACFLRLSFWDAVDRACDMTIAFKLAHGALGRRTQDETFPKDWEPSHRVSLFRVDGFRAQAARELAALGFRPRPVESPPGALEVVSPERWRPIDGWHSLALNDDLIPFRWTGAPRVKIHLSRPLGPGAATIVLLGYRLPYPQPVQDLTIGIEGEPSSAILSLSKGWFDCRARLVLTRRHERPVLVLGHPVFQSGQARPAGEAPFEMGFLLRMAAVVKSSPDDIASAGPGGTGLLGASASGATIRQRVLAK